MAFYPDVHPDQAVVPLTPRRIVLNQHSWILNNHHIGILGLGSIGKIFLLLAPRGQSARFTSGYPQPQHFKACLSPIFPVIGLVFFSTSVPVNAFAGGFGVLGDGWVGSVFFSPFLELCVPPGAFMVCPPEVIFRGSVLGLAEGSLCCQRDSPILCVTFEPGFSLCLPSRCPYRSKANVQSAECGAQSREPPS